MTTSPLPLIDWREDLADRLHTAAAIVDCVVLGGRCNFATYARKLDVASQLRGLAAVARERWAEPGGEPSWLTAMAERLRLLEKAIRVCVRFRCIKDKAELDDLVSVSAELRTLADEADELMLGVTMAARGAA